MAVLISSDINTNSRKIKMQTCDNKDEQSAASELQNLCTALFRLDTEGISKICSKKVLSSRTKRAGKVVEYWKKLRKTEAAQRNDVLLKLQKTCTKSARICRGCGCVDCKQFQTQIDMRENALRHANKMVQLSSEILECYNRISRWYTNEKESGS